ncbi:MAG: DUF4296 domain-containing protein [Tenacibaculum sp.]
MNKIVHSLLLFFLVACTSNTIYKKPKDLIPKDTMAALLTDMYLATSAKGIKNKFLNQESNYMFLVYQKYKIDSLRFNNSSMYYTSRADEYSEILNKVKTCIDSLQKKYQKLQHIQDSLYRSKTKLPFKKQPKLLPKLQRNNKPEAPSSTTFKTPEGCI